MSSKELEAFAKFERYYDAAGIRTRCFEKGEGKPVILLHGGGGHAETWVRNLMPLAEKFRVLAIDYLGHGYTDKPKITYNLDAFSKHLQDFMSAAGIDKSH
jgi:2-hydroxy-6-oxonona-2,4-dienedioate hydrolase